MLFNFKKKKSDSNKSESDKEINGINQQPDIKNEEAVNENQPETAQEPEAKHEEAINENQPETAQEPEVKEHTETKAEAEKNPNRTIDPILDRKFREIFEPHILENNKIQARTLEQIPNFDTIKPGLRERALEMDQKRVDDPALPSREAAKEIFNILMPLLTKEGNNTPEYIIAVFAALGGRECIHNVMKSLFAMTDRDDPERGKSISETGTKIGIWVGNKNGIGYVFGDKMNEVVARFCGVTFRSNFQTVVLNDLMKSSETVFKQCGTETYWNTQYNSAIGKTPEELINLYSNQFELIYSVYCRFPQERIMAIAIAAQFIINNCLEQKAIPVEIASSIAVEYILRAAHYFPRELEVSILQNEAASFSVSGADFVRHFVELYAPYTIDGYVIKERTPDEMPELDNENPQLNTIAQQIELKRKDDPIIGAKYAANDIYKNVMNWLNEDNCVEAEVLLATLASIGGRICIQELMNTIISMASPESPERKKLIHSMASMLSIVIDETENGDTYIKGDRTANEFMVFLNNAIGESVDVKKIVSHAEKLEKLNGKDNYWETPYDDLVGKSPQKLADMYIERFDVLFKIYCRFPQEKLLAVAFATQQATKEVIKQNVIDKNDAIDIITEYGWRTSHYWGKLDI